ncbi:group II intron reverse transcriptase/maturase [Alicyclobacillus tolerans]|uniref:group II intron reverse transcriptase/maturase n=1 Tax=Alicyclobacillus tolerans TaxID=90970 RepID=UPI003B79F547
MSTVTQSSTLEAKRFETQARLARRSLEQRPFSRLHHLLRWNVWIDLSIERVLRNKGAYTPGVDNKTKKDYATPEARQKLREDVKQVLRMYSSSPVRRIFIPKNHKPHETRPLGIPTIVDRAAQDAVRSILEPIYEGKQHPHSYGFRPYRCTHHAIERIRFLIGRHRYCWVVELDIKGFFDNVDHEILLDILRWNIHDRRFIKVIRNMLKAGLVYAGEFEGTELGTPQGGVASPILGNIYLNELDEFIANKYEYLSPRDRRKATIPCYIVRYADDAVILCRSKEHAETLKAEIAEYLSNTLKLQLSEQKTLVTHADKGFDFLGFNIRRWKRQGKERVLAKPSHKAIQRFKSTMAKDSRAFLGAPGAAVISNLNRKIRGFAEYFRRGNAKESFAALDYYLWWLVFRRFQQRTREPPSIVAKRNQYRYNESANLPHHRRSTARNFGFRDDNGNVHVLDKLGLYKIEYPNKCSQKNPYVPEDREWLDRNRKLRETMRVQRARYIERLYGLSENWASYRKYVVTRQDGRCARCACKLTGQNTHVDYWPGVAGDIRIQMESIPDNLLALCIPCYRRKQERSNKKTAGQSEQRAN